MEALYGTSFALPFYYKAYLLDKKSKGVREVAIPRLVKERWISWEEGLKKGFLPEPSRNLVSLLPETPPEDLFPFLLPRLSFATLYPFLLEKKWGWLSALELHPESQGFSPEVRGITLLGYCMKVPFSLCEERVSSCEERRICPKGVNPSGDLSYFLGKEYFFRGRLNLAERWASLAYRTTGRKEDRELLRLIYLKEGKVGEARLLSSE
jgi:hypothetical protein